MLTPFMSLQQSHQIEQHWQPRPAPLLLPPWSMCSGLQGAGKSHNNGWFLNRDKHVLCVFQVSQMHAAR